MKYITICLSALIIFCLLFSCGKVHESIQRDIFLTGDSSTFSVPIIADTISLLKLGEFKINMDLDAMIKKQLSDFTVADIRNIRISQVNLKFSGTDKINNLQNFAFLNAQILNNGKDSLTLASKDNFPDVPDTLTNLSIANGTRDLKPYLNGTNTTYLINGILQHATTKVLKATFTPTYTVTLGK